MSSDTSKLLKELFVSLPVLALAAVYLAVKKKRFQLGILYIYLPRAVSISGNQRQC